MPALPGLPTPGDVAPPAPTLTPAAPAPVLTIEPVPAPAPAPVGAGLPPIDEETPSSPKRRTPVGLLVALFAVAVVGIAGFFVLSGGNSSGDESDAPAVTRPAPNPAAAVDSEPETAIGQILDDANDVVGDVNANAQEEELLGELGLDATGNPVVVQGAAVGYRFTWADPSGQDLDIIVDTAADNYAVTASDGISFRFIEGNYFGQSGADGEWYELADDPFGEIPVVGLDGIPSEAEVLPSSVAPFVVSDTIDGPTRVVMIDDAAFAAADLDARNEWLAPWGLIDESAASASSVVIRLTFDPSTGSVVGAHVETPAIGGFASFSISETYEVAPVIENPMPSLPADEVAVDLGE